MDPLTLFNMSLWRGQALHVTVQDSTSVSSLSFADLRYPNPLSSMDHRMDHKMVLKDTDSTVRPTGIEATLLLNLLILTCFVFPSLKVARYQIWYSSIATSIGLYSLSELWNPCYTCFGATIHTILNLPHTMLIIFIFVFLFRYVRLVGNLIAFTSYRATAVLDRPNLTGRDVTVIIPTLAPYGKDLKECINSVQANGPAKTIIVTAGPENRDRLFEYICLHPNVTITHCDTPNKRLQICKALPEV